MIFIKRMEVPLNNEVKPKEEVVYGITPFVVHLEKIDIARNAPSTRISA